jgi:predicted O-methyltransferase YrrM
MNIRRLARDIAPPFLLRALGGGRRSEATRPRGKPNEGIDPSPVEARARKSAVREARRTVMTDPGLAWLTRSIPGWLNPGNVAAFDHVARHLPPGAVVEIGSYAGLSLTTLHYLLRKHGLPNPLFSTDTWVFEVSDDPLAVGPASLTPTERRAAIADTFDRAVRLNCRGSLPHHFELDSDAFFAAWRTGAPVTDFFGRTATPGGPIAFAYVDGDHSAAQSWRDFENVARHLSPGGFVLFDDSADGTHWGCHDSAVRAAATPGFTLVSKAPNYLVRKV